MYFLLAVADIFKSLLCKEFCVISLSATNEEVYLAVETPCICLPQKLANVGYKGRPSKLRIRHHGF